MQNAAIRNFLDVLIAQVFCESKLKNKKVKKTEIALLESPLISRLLSKGMKLDKQRVAKAEKLQ